MTWLHFCKVSILIRIIKSRRGGVTVGADKDIESLIQKENEIMQSDTITDGNNEKSFLSNKFDLLVLPSSPPLNLILK